MLFERQYREGDAGYSIVIDDSAYSVTTFVGKGTMSLTRHYIGSLNDSMEAVPRGTRVLSEVDLSQLHGSPLRAQVLLGRWLLSHRDSFHRIAIWGARPWEARIARAVMTIARMDRVRHFKAQPEAEAWLRER